jgi:hypothetical protein
MKNLLCTLAALGAISVAPLTASAADHGGYEDRETYVERPARIIERERIVEHQYYDPRYDESRDYEEPDQGYFFDLFERELGPALRKDKKS